MMSGRSSCAGMPESSLTTLSLSAGTRRHWYTARLSIPHAAATRLAPPALLMIDEMSMPLLCQT